MVELVKMKEYTSIFRKPDLLVMAIIISYIVMGATMAYQAAMLVRIQMLYINAGLWIDEDYNPHIGNLETYQKQVEGKEYLDIIPLSDLIPETD